MNGLELHLGLLDFATGAVEFAFNWLLQSTLLIATGLIVARLLRSRGSAVQSVVCRTTLVAVLVCPMASWSLSLAGVSGWSVELPDGWAYAQVEPAPRSVATSVPTMASSLAPPAFARRVSLESHSLGEESAIEREAVSGVAAIASNALESHDPPLAIAGPPADLSTEVTPEATRLFTIRGFGLATLAITAGWFLVSALLLARLAGAWRRLSRLRRGSVRADSEVMRDCHEVASMLGVSAPDVLRSPYLASPCLAGLVRPTIFLPAGKLGLSVRDALIHELAHLKRRDCHWNLLRQAATALFFFQPLLWKLSGRIEWAAEEVCDDYVITHGGDRREYAHRLVDIAELFSQPITAAGVGIVSLRSVLLRRVARIMDTSRTVSTRAGGLAFALVVAGGLIGTTVVAMIGLGPQPSQAEVRSSAAESNEVPIDEDVSIKVDREGAADDDAVTVRGTVVDPDANPVAGATVCVARWYWDPNIPNLPLATTTTNAAGRFEVTYHKSQFNVDVQRPEMWKETTIIAGAQGFGPGWVQRDELAPGEEPTLHLVRDDVPITGRVVDLDGNPLSGITITPAVLTGSADESLDAWLDALGRGEMIWEASNRYFDKRTPYVPRNSLGTIRTKSDGSFEIAGLGRERWLRVSLEGPTIAYTKANLVTRKMEPVEAADGVHRPEWSMKSIVYGADCQIVVQPTQPIVGTIRDAETGDPLPGVAIESYRMTEHGISAGREVRVESDDRGRFRLVGMPNGVGKRIIAVPNDNQPYLMREFDVPDKPGLEPIEMELELHRGVWLSGRVSDKATGEPVPVRIHYLPYRSNPFAQAVPEFDKHGNVDGYQSRYNTNEEGLYRIVGLPGLAIMGVESVTQTYPSGMGHEEIEGLDEDGHFPTYRNPINPSKKWPTAMREIDVAPDGEPAQLDFELDSGLSIKITTVDPRGREVGGVDVEGKGDRDYWQSVESATFNAVAFAPGEERTLLFHQPQRQLGKVVHVTVGEDTPQEMTVQLQPCVVIRGRLVDDKGQPITGARIRISPGPGGDFSPELKAIPTDAEGRFEHKGVLPGAPYAVWAESVQFRFTTLARELAVAPGETIDLGTIDVTTDERPTPLRSKAAGDR